MLYRHLLLMPQHVLGLAWPGLAYMCSSVLCWLLCPVQAKEKCVVQHGSRHACAVSHPCHNCGAGVAIRGGGEASGPLWWPADIREDMFSAGTAAARAYADAGVGPADVDYFGLYDCFPVCLIRCGELALSDGGAAGAAAVVVQCVTLVAGCTGCFSAG
jgi:hypothetical protein